MSARTAGIFISYAHQDREMAKALAQALADQGWSVWWDRQIPSGRRFDEVIERELTAARCVIVLWSKAALRSQWVREEAQDGLDRDILVPARIETISLPIGFRTIQTADLVGWKGDQAHPGFAQLMADIAVVLGKPPLKAWGAEPKAKPKKPAEQPPGALSLPEWWHAVSWLAKVTFWPIGVAWLFGRQRDPMPRWMKYTIVGFWLLVAFWFLISDGNRPPSFGYPSSFGYPPSFGYPSSFGY